jgi:prepilin-type N-terminal cleavage/methylation domain-containing protein
MLTKLKNKNEGFTIVETLIVLAIAGLIILIVLLAVPALQRSSQNSNIKSDAEAVSSAINDFESNNQGVQPVKADITGVAGSGKVSIGAGGSTVASTAKIQPATTVTPETATATSPKYVAGAATGNEVGVGYILLDIGYECPSVAGSAGGQALTSDPSAVAVFYPINDGSGATGGVGCLQS